MWPDYQRKLVTIIAYLESLPQSPSTQLRINELTSELVKLRRLPSDAMFQYALYLRSNYDPATPTIRRTY